MCYNALWCHALWCHWHWYPGSKVLSHEMPLFRCFWYHLRIKFDSWGLNFCPSVKIFIISIHHRIQNFEWFLQLKNIEPIFVWPDPNYDNKLNSPNGDQKRTSILWEIRKLKYSFQDDQKWLYLISFLPTSS